MKEELIAVFDKYIDEYFPKGDKRRGEVLLIGAMIIARALELQELMQKVTTIANDDDKVSRVAVMLQEFMKQANSEEYWQGERSGRGFVRSWARRIVEVQ